MLPQTKKQTNAAVNLGCEVLLRSSADGPDGVCVVDILITDVSRLLWSASRPNQVARSGDWPQPA